MPIIKIYGSRSGLLQKLRFFRIYCTFSTTHNPLEHCAAATSSSLTAENRRACFSNKLIYCHDVEKWPANLLEKIKRCEDVKIFPGFVNEQEEAQFEKDTHQQLRRLRYENEHWDDAIHQYREIEKSNWSPVCQRVIDQMRELAFPAESRLLNSVHVLDLAQDGYIKPHIDSDRYCGDIIAGLSLLTDSVMRLVHKDHKQLVFDMYLKRFSLYVLKGIARYEFTHEILAAEQASFNGTPVPRTSRRLAVICRVLPKSTAAYPDDPKAIS